VHTASAIQPKQAVKESHDIQVCCQINDDYKASIEVIAKLMRKNYALQAYVCIVIIEHKWHMAQNSKKIQYQHFGAQNLSQN